MHFHHYLSRLYKKEPVAPQDRAKIFPDSQQVSSENAQLAPPITLGFTLPHIWWQRCRISPHSRSAEPGHLPMTTRSGLSFKPSNRITTMSTEHPPPPPTLSESNATDAPPPQPSLAGQPYFSYVHACAYDKWAGGIRTEKYVWALSTGFCATEICAEFSCGQLTRAWNLLEQAISSFSEDRHSN